jgi:hypothetical protein
MTAKAAFKAITMTVAAASTGQPVHHANTGSTTASG